MLESSADRAVQWRLEVNVAELDDARRMLQRAGISVSEGDEARMQQFLGRLRPIPTPSWKTEPWLLPGHRLEWPRD